MKKINMLLLSALAAFSFTGCVQDTEPKAKQPENPDFLNTPALANQTYELQTAGAINLTCSQPDYDVALQPTYAVQVSLDKNFASVPAEWVYNAEKATPYVELDYTTQSTSLAVSAEKVANAISTIIGIDDVSQYDGIKPYSGPLYIRLRSYISGLEGSLADYYTIISNVIELKNVVSYPSVLQPGWIYLVGAPEGWVGPDAGQAAHYNDWRLFEAENAIGSKIYSGTFTIPAGKFIFRFYTALTGWDADSYGSQADDNPVDIEFINGVYDSAIVKGKGSFQDPSWDGGEVHITVNLATMSVAFTKVN